MYSFRPIVIASSLLAIASGLGGRALADDNAKSPPSQGVAPAAQGTFTILYRFQFPANGSSVEYGGVVLDGEGNIYGTQQGGGVCLPCGVIFKLVKPTRAGGAWMFRILHKFTRAGGDGIEPKGPLIINGTTLYGTASAGGLSDNGTVFQISTSGSDYRILHHFNRQQGATPIGGVQRDSDGTLYGTTFKGGLQDAGTIYKISPGGVFSVLHNFGQAGGGPIGELIFGKDGALYGTSISGGKYGKGQVFRITRDGAFGDLYDFRKADGADSGPSPQGRLALDKDGRIHGTTWFGGVGDGSTWSLSPPKLAAASWLFNETHAFRRFKPPSSPIGGLVIDSAGKLYGAASSNALYKLSPTETGTRFPVTVLHNFQLDAPQGAFPIGDLTLRLGSLYGMMRFNESPDERCLNGCGAVFVYHQ